MSAPSRTGQTHLLPSLPCGATPGVIEHAELVIAPGREAEFEEAFAHGHPAVAQAAGYRWARLIRQIENPRNYLLLVGWETVEAHTVDFRQSELFQLWREAVGDFFATPIVI